ncbi:SOS-response transcriptional repressor, LexA (plasmid) [Leptolyngbya sp. NIES-3755]|nr:SOS-response transcriptional repressor, LexA [Leptolyngbya sp. NIES-3755]
MIVLTPKQQRLADWITAYIHEFSYSPLIREMRIGLSYTSSAPIQSLLDKLEQKGVIIRVEKSARTIRFTEQWLRQQQSNQANPLSLRLPIVGTIAAHSLVEVVSDNEIEWLDFPLFPGSKAPGIEKWFVLRVWGDSMIDALIDHNDFVILKPEPNADTVKNGAIVAARVGTQTTLKYFYRKDGQVILKPANPNYSDTTVPAAAVEIQGVFMGLIRGFCKVDCEW